MLKNAPYALISVMLDGALLAGVATADELFTRWDRNGDGKLARDELPARARKNFKRVDTDGDGSISLQEHETFVERGRRRRHSRTGQQQQRGQRRMRVPDNVELHQDLPYADTDNPRQKLDLLIPRKAGGPLPLVVFVHGGAWRGGNKSSGVDRLAKFVAGGDYAGASIAYRLSGEAKWPAQIHDCKAAIRWLKANAAKYRIDPKRIAVWGASAGGHLVAMLGVSGGVEELEGSLGSHRDHDSRVTCVLDWFGPTNFLTMNDQPGSMDHDAPDSPESLLVGGPIKEHPDRVRHASPLTYVSADDPPFLIAHGTEDRLVPFAQSIELYEALKKAGVTPAPLLARMVGAGHGHGVGGEELDLRVQQFLDMHLRGIPAEISEAPIQVH